MPSEVVEYSAPILNQGVKGVPRHDFILDCYIHTESWLGCSIDFTIDLDCTKECWGSERISE